jgi:acetylornithine deacetylase/succinyl-diaminopimelate desuccinylase-like protein
VALSPRGFEPPTAWEMDDQAARQFAFDELVRLIEIPSISDKEHEAMAYLVDRCRELGLPAEALPVNGSAPNVLVGWDPAPVLLLTAHIDTIRPTWDADYRARVDGSLVYGLGAQDDKGCAVAILLALLLARNGGADVERLPVALGFCVDEEIGGKGSRAMADLLRPPFVVASEGTELDIAVTETGFVEGRITVEGRSLHGSLMEEADNPLIRSARLTLDLVDAPFTRFEHPTAGRNMATVLGLTSTERANATPERVSMHLSARVFGQPALEEVARQFEEIARAHGAIFELEEKGGWWETSWDAPLVRALSRASEQAIGRTPAPTRMPAWTDAHSFADRSDSEVVVFGPGHLRAAHRPDEHIDVDEVVRCARILAALIADVEGLAHHVPSRVEGGTR